MVSVLPVADEKMRLNHERPELRESITDPATPTNNIPSKIPAISAQPAADLADGDSCDILQE